ncbi:MAG: PTS transporter subunit EIIA [Ignavibacteria bacterium]|jgi:Kef-type K+ transport system membrane component KefB|nr:PTS transporter subunit EIIA [Ignavibacteria bacterium]MCU7504144.1 PTS transporter subunit EIIA [Ignavibacteria bacterium]MCU7516406.1 PTS transporter subunit EIIA [Ignavibacteria bacterium]
MRLDAEQLTVFLTSISIMLLMARLLGELFIKLKQPAIIGEILAGIILGPTVLGVLMPGFSAWLFPKTPEIQVAMDGIFSLAVIMLLLVSGLEVDLAVVVRQSKTAFLTSFMGIIFPFALGFALAYMYPNYFGINDEKMRLIFSLFMGTAMSISALPVIARTLMDLNLIRTEIGLIILAAAMFGDLAGWIIFSLILSMMGAGGGTLGFSDKILLILGFTLFMLLIGRKIVNKIFPYIQKYFVHPGGVLNFIFILGFLCAAFTEFIGVHAIFGAFIVGITIGDTAHLREKTREIIHQFVTNIFAPLFFVSIGLRVNLLTNFDPLLVLIVVFIAFTGKVIGCGLGAYWGNMSRRDSLVIGFGMNSRGAMEIILGLLALQFGLIQDKVFVALVIMAVFTSLISAPVMNYFLKGRMDFSLRDILDRQMFIISSAPDKDSVIREMVSLAAKKYNIDEETLFQQVKSREELIPTGIANYLAVPHAKAKVSRPVAVVAFHKEGLDFEASDKLPAKVILLLLTPQDKSELQLKLLAEIANKFKDKDSVESLINTDKPESIISALKNA